jgi:hypothetical protein
MAVSILPTGGGLPQSKSNLINMPPCIPLCETNPEHGHGKARRIPIRSSSSTDLEEQPPENKEIPSGKTRG